MTPMNLTHTLQDLFRPALAGLPYTDQHLSMIRPAQKAVIVSDLAIDAEFVQSPPSWPRQ